MVGTFCCNTLISSLSIWSCRWNKWLCMSHAWMTIVSCNLDFPLTIKVSWKKKRSLLTKRTYIWTLNHYTFFVLTLLKPIWSLFSRSFSWLIFKSESSSPISWLHLYRKWSTNCLAIRETKRQYWEVSCNHSKIVVIEISGKCSTVTHSKVLHNTYVLI